MEAKLRCVMLVDDNPDDNYFHQRVICKYDHSLKVISMESASEAMAFLKSNPQREIHPDLIFLDVNIPGMNGWEFLDAFNNLDAEIREKSVVVLLTTSEDQQISSREKPRKFLTDFKSKPLTVNILQDLKAKYFLD